MNRKSWIYLLVVLLIIVAVVVFWRVRRPGEAPAIDLVARFPEAEKRTTMPNLHDGFEIVEVTIQDETRRSIFAHPFGRIIWTVKLPGRAVLTTAVALRPHVWPLPGDGAQFRIGVSDGRTYDELFRQMVNPGVAGNPADRRWIPVRLDLSAYGGQEVQVIFNTDPGPHGNAVNDAAVWGAPRIVRE